jgi:large subunit ribosomal protein L21
VLLINTGDQTILGHPLVNGAAVRGTVAEVGKGNKVLVFKYKKKKQYRRTRGHRQTYSEVKIEEIQTGARDDDPGVEKSV